VRDAPGIILTATMWAYYGVSVPVMVVRARRRTGRPVGFVPELRRERVMWLIWAPLMLAWMVLPYLALTRRHPLLAVPPIALADPVLATVRWAAAICGVLCFCGVLECIARMGTNWRVAVVPSQRTELVTEGLYARIRHPIYGFNVLLMLCSAIIVPTVPMCAVGVIHVALIVLKVRNEERFLLATHGAEYAAYCRRTGRFFPRLLARDA
jgi:protein-S-isoprenylcysteine O-methyltransferase Ste14